MQMSNFVKTVYGTAEISMKKFVKEHKMIVGIAYIIVANLIFSALLTILLRDFWESVEAVFGIVGIPLLLSFIAAKIYDKEDEGTVSITAVVAYIIPLLVASRMPSGTNKVGTIVVGFLLIYFLARGNYFKKLYERKLRDEEINKKLMQGGHNNNEM